MQSKVDLAVIGSGGAAFAAAIRATALGKAVVMVERGTIGGTCVNTGCIPSKALIAAAEARHVAADASTRFPGIATIADPVDMAALVGGKQDLVEALRGEKYVDVADSYGWQIRHGTLVAENAFTGTDRSVDYTRLPRVTFTGPAIGAVGMTEAQVLAAGIRCDCRVLPLDYVPRALVNRDTRGFIKMVANADTGEILGLTAVAKDAGELAAAGVHILGKTIAEVADAWAPYLTMAEGIRIVAKAFTTDVSKLSCCA